MSLVYDNTTSLADSTDWDVEVSGGTDKQYDVTTIVHGGACDVKMVYAADGDFSSPDIEITLDSFTGSGISQDNRIPINEHKQYRLRITNTSGGAADFVVIGSSVK